MVKLQQGLQQVYCAGAVKSGQLGITEANALAYAAGSTFFQEHGFASTFADTSRIVRNRVAPTPDQQLFVQMHSAMCTLGLTFEDLRTMEEPKQIFEFWKATFAATIQDTKQNVYQSDYIVHSVMQVSKEVAEANLQPIPGTVEYAPGCSACFYRKHVLPGGETMYCQYNLSLSEDQRQILTGRTLDNECARDDCETDVSRTASLVNCANSLWQHCLEAKDGEEVIQLDPVLWSGHSAKEQKAFVNAAPNMFKRLAKPMLAKMVIGNAFSAAAGMEAANVCGHEYGVSEMSIYKPDHFRRGKKGPSSYVTLTTSLEGTKWVNVRRKAADPKVCQMENQVAMLLKEVTKIPTMDPMDDIGSNQMVVNLPLATSDNMAPDKHGFYACAYVMDDMLLRHRVSDPSGQFCKMVLGAPLSQVVDGARCLDPIRISYNLMATQLNEASPGGLKKISGKHVQDMMDRMAADCTVPAWPKEKWQKCVFDNYIPCSIQYEDAKALKLMENGDYSCMVFTHESSKGNIKLQKPVCTGASLQEENSKPVYLAQEYVQSILSVLHDGAAPQITAVHARRVLEVPPYVGMDMGSLKGKLKTFDHKRVNAAMEGKLQGLLRVARIATHMGCVTTVCLARKADLPKISEVLMNWAKPVVAAQQMKAQLGLEWRMKLEGRS